VKAIQQRKASEHNADQRQFDSTLDDWDSKVSKIRKGITPEEMIAVAGQPRISAVVSVDDIIAGYTGTKYNYGTKWVLFNNNLVSTVK
jgi:hypothetical protein